MARFSHAAQDRRVLTTTVWEEALGPDMSTIQVSPADPYRSHPNPSPTRRPRPDAYAEDDDPASSADGLPQSGHLASRSRADPASGHMSDGAHTPLTRARPDQPANLPDPPAGSKPAPAKPCQPPFTGRQIGPLEQARSRHGELMRLARARG